MGRIRTIKPEFFSDRKVGSLSCRERLAFIWTWTAADDCGRLEWEPALLRAGAFPFDEVLMEDSRSIQGALMRAGLVRVYEVNGEQFAEIVGFAKHQVINRPSKPRCPAPDAADRWLTEGSVSTPGALPEGSLQEGKGREGIGMDPPYTPPSGGTVDSDPSDPEVLDAEAVDEAPAAKSEPAEKPERPGDAAACDAFIATYREYAVPAGLPDCKRTAKLVKAAGVALRGGCDCDEFADRCKGAAASPHHRGENDRGWVATIRWLLDDPGGKAAALAEKYRAGVLTREPVRERGGAEMLMDDIRRAKADGRLL